MSEYIVIYLDCNVFRKMGKKTETLTKSQLAEMLQNGAIVVLEAKIKR